MFFFDLLCFSSIFDDSHWLFDGLLIIFLRSSEVFPHAAGLWQGPIAGCGGGCRFGSNFLAVVDLKLVVRRC